MLNTAWLKSLEITELATKSPQIPSIDVAKVDKRLYEARSARKQAIDRVGVDVPPEAQRMFNAINKTWATDTIHALHAINMLSMWSASDN